MKGKGLRWRPGTGSGSLYELARIAHGSRTSKSPGRRRYRCWRLRRTRPFGCAKETRCRRSHRPDLRLHAVSGTRLLPAAVAAVFSDPSGPGHGWRTDTRRPASQRDHRSDLRHPARPQSVCAGRRRRSVTVAIRRRRQRRNHAPCSSILSVRRTQRRSARSHARDRSRRPYGTHRRDLARQRVEDERDPGCRTAAGSERTATRDALIAGRPSSDISCRTRDFSISGGNSPLDSAEHAKTGVI